MGDLFRGASARPIVFATLAEVRRRFVDDFGAASDRRIKRQEIWDGWMRHRAELQAEGAVFATLVNGSFVTDKPEPSDVDIAIVLDALWYNNLSEAQKERVAPLLDARHCKGAYYCDAYPLFVYPHGHARFTSTLWAMTYWTRVFGHFKATGEQKAFLVVADGGVAT